MGSNRLLKCILICMLILVLVSSKFSLKKNMGKLGDKVKKASEKVGHSSKDIAKKAETLAKNIKEDINDTVVKTVTQITTEMKKDLDKLKGETGPQAEAVRAKIIEDAQKKLEAQIKSELKNSSYEASLKDILKGDLDPEELKKMIKGADLPDILKDMVKNLDEADLENRNWNLPREAEQRLNEILNFNNPEMEELYKAQVEKAVNNVAQGGDIKDATKDLTKFLEDKIVDRDELEGFLEDLDYTIEDLQDESEDKFDIIKFEIEDFRDEVKDTIDKMEDQYEDLEPEQKQELSNYMLMSNTNLDSLLGRIMDKDTRDRVIKRFRNEVQKELAKGSRNYDDIMDEVDSMVSNIEQDQTMKIKDSSIKLRTPYILPPRQQFTFSIEDVLAKSRSDVDFFEFITVEMPDQVIIGPDDNEEGFVYVTADLISGVSFSEEGVYVYDVTLKHSSFRNGSEPYLIETTLTMEVSNSAEEGGKSGQIQHWMLILCAILGLTSLVLIAYQCYSKFFSNKVIKYEDMGSGVGESHDAKISRDSDF